MEKGKEFGGSSSNSLNLGYRVLNQPKRKLKKVSIKDRDHSLHNLNLSMVKKLHILSRYGVYFSYW